MCTLKVYRKDIMGNAHKLPIGVLISGGGTNLQRIIDTISEGTLDAEVVVVISNKKEAHGLTRAHNAGIKAFFLNPDQYEDEHQHNEAIKDSLLSHGAEYVVMAGYMSLLGKEVLYTFPNRVINLHPALLPSFPGAHGIEDAFYSGVKVTGVTVQFANERFDDGPIIAQETVRIEEHDTLETLKKKIHETEYKILPETLQKLAEGRVHVRGKKVEIS